MTEGERRSEIVRRACVTRRERARELACHPLTQFQREMRERRRDFNRQVRQRTREREAWLDEWFERHRSELMHEDEEISNRSWLALKEIWRFADKMNWLRQNIETLYEDDETTNSLVAALDVIRRYAAGIGIAAFYEPCVPLIRRKMQLGKNPILKRKGIQNGNKG